MSIVNLTGNDRSLYSNACFRNRTILSSPHVGRRQVPRRAPGSCRNDFRLRPLWRTSSGLFHFCMNLPAFSAVSTTRSHTRIMMRSSLHISSKARGRSASIPGCIATRERSEILVASRSHSFRYLGSDRGWNTRCLQANPGETSEKTPSLGRHIE